MRGRIDTVEKLASSVKRGEMLVYQWKGTSYKPRLQSSFDLNQQIIGHSMLEIGEVSEILEIMTRASFNYDEPMTAFINTISSIECSFRIRCPASVHIPTTGNPTLYSMSLALVFRKGDPVWKPLMDRIVRKLQQTGIVDHWYTLAKINTIRFMKMWENIDGSQSQSIVKGKEGSLKAIAVRHIFSLLILYGSINLAGIFDLLMEINIVEKIRKIFNWK